MSISRRRFLEIAGVAGGAVALRSTLLPSVARADDPTPQLFLACYFGGGWDQMLALDPRDNSNPMFQKEQAYSQSGSGIYPAYDLVQDSNVAALLAKNASGVQKAGNLTFGPAVPQSFLQHATDLSLCRGIFMGTLGHDTGRRYFITGKFPRGLEASGSSLATSVAAAQGQNASIPNLAVNVEAYNQNFPPFATPIPVEHAADLQNLLNQLGTPLDAKSEAALVAFQQLDLNCQEQLDNGIVPSLNGMGLVDVYRGSQVKARSMVSSTAAAAFNFKVPAPNQQIQAVFDAFGITKSSDVGTEKGNAAIAAVALTQGISQAVSVEVAQGIDDHADWPDSHATNIYSGFDAIGNLISYLKATEYTPGGKPSGKATWEYTTILVFSEFARTPLLNGRNGRDHHIASSCVVGGPGIKGGMVIGATSDWQLTAQNCDYSTGKATQDMSSGVPLRPTDIHATLLHSMGLPYDVLSNNVPLLIDALLK